MTFLKKYYKRIILFIFDYICCFAACAAASYFHSVKGGDLQNSLIAGLIFASIVVLFRVFAGIYTTIFHFVNPFDYIRFFIGDIAAFALMALLRLVKVTPFADWPLSVIIVSTLAAFVVALLSRLTYRVFRLILRKKRAPSAATVKTSVAIFGAGDAGMLLLEELKNNRNSRYEPYCFLDDNVTKIGSYIGGLRVRGTGYDVVKVLEKTDVRDIIIAIPSISPSRKKQFIEACTDAGYKVLQYEHNLLDGEDGDEESLSIKKINIEDLLFRSPIRLSADVSGVIGGKRVLITGGGGSIGSEICRQVSAGKPSKLIILDIYENNAYDIQNELRRKYGDKLDMDVVIASVRDREKIDRIFDKYRPEVVFHAAAHKHVPLMEDCCDEAVKNNVFGTLNVADAAEKYGAAKMVLISTDKAVNPTNVMGATKRLCEMIIQSRTDSKTDYLAVRFGNVLGSNGSVIPLFKAQIENGGPVTVTDKRIIRYFMTIPEATSLVLEAAALAESSDIFVLDMGKPVKILDLAVNMIKLAGYQPYVDIDIKEIGLRPGEKLYEELLVDYNKCGKTENEKIFIEHTDRVTREEVAEKLKILWDAAESCDNEKVKEAIRKTVPTYCVVNENAKEAEMIEN